MSLEKQKILCKYVYKCLAIEILKYATDLLLITYIPTKTRFRDGGFRMGEMIEDAQIGEFRILYCKNKQLIDLPFMS
jgi:hypothetical protein